MKENAEEFGRTDYRRQRRSGLETLMSKEKEIENMMEELESVHERLADTESLARYLEVRNLLTIALQPGFTQLELIKNRMQELCESHKGSALERCLLRRAVILMGG